MERLLNGSSDEGRGSGLWNVDDLYSCFADEKVCVSFGLWLLSCLFWFTSMFLHFYLRSKRKAAYNESVFWHIYSFLGSMCNTTGAILSKQLTIQVITGSYMAIADVIHFILTLFPVCNSKHRSRSGQKNSRKRKKQKAILSALSISLFFGLGWFTFTPSGSSYSEAPHANQRRLLGTVLQESTDIVGFSLGIIAVVVSWTVRVPIITKVRKGMVFSVMQIWAVFFSALASFMYATAIMSHDRHPEYFIKAIPWFLISLGAAAMDVALTILSCIMKTRLFGQMGFVVDAMGDGDGSELLVKYHEPEKNGDNHNKPEDDDENSSWTPLKIVPNRNHSSRASFEGYMKLSIEQVQETICSAARSRTSLRWIILGPCATGSTSPACPSSTTRSTAYRLHSQWIIAVSLLGVQSGTLCLCKTSQRWITRSLASHCIDPQHRQGSACSPAW
uniref:Transmembrane protein 44 n=1 Tax=Leptobrachium leishanense TaxID=445787 RepID=A0A8C5MS66_9ANUR